MLIPKQARHTSNRANNELEHNEKIYSVENFYVRGRNVKLYRGDRPNTRHRQTITLFVYFYTKL